MCRSRRGRKTSESECNTKKHKLKFNWEKKHNHLVCYRMCGLIATPNDKRKLGGIIRYDDGSKQALDYNCFWEGSLWWNLSSKDIELQQWLKVISRQFNPCSLLLTGQPGRGYTTGQGLSRPGRPCQWQCVWLGVSLYCLIGDLILTTTLYCYSIYSNWLDL